MLNSGVAVILSTYNGGKYIAEQLRSLVNQEYKNIDVFIHDDGSIDNTLDIIKEFTAKFSNFHLLEAPTGQRYPMCFVNLLREVDGYQYYAFCDQDDVWEEYKILEAVHCLETKKNTEPLLYYTAVEYTDSKLNFIRSSRFAEGKNKICKLTLQSLLFGGEAMGMTFVFNEVAKNALVKANETKAYKDWFLKLYCAACGEVYYNPHPSAKYRRHDTAVTNGSNPSGKFDRYLSQIREIYFDKETFNTQRCILTYMLEQCPQLILKENQELFDLFVSKNTLKNRLKKFCWKKRFRSKTIDEIGYRIAFLFGRI